MQDSTWNFSNGSVKLHKAHQIGKAKVPAAVFLILTSRKENIPSSGFYVATSAKACGHARRADDATVYCIHFAQNK